MASNPDEKILVKSFSWTDPIAYIEHIDEPSQQVKFTEKLTVTRVKPEVAQKLGKLVRDYKLRFIVFSASWCKDCQEVLPALAKINQIANIPMKILGGAKINQLVQANGNKWHIPPSPPEMNTYNIEKVPAILILDGYLHEIARMYERPPPGKTLEAYLLGLIETALGLGKT
jgi:thiol-disulfide isomerase/thioredoxin